MGTAADQTSLQVSRIWDFPKKKSTQRSFPSRLKSRRRRFGPGACARRTPFPLSAFVMTAGPDGSCGPCGRPKLKRGDIPMWATHGARPQYCAVVVDVDDPGKLQNVLAEGDSLLPNWCVYNRKTGHAHVVYPLAPSRSRTSRIKSRSPSLPCRHREEADRRP